MNFNNGKSIPNSLYSFYLDIGYNLLNIKINMDTYRLLSGSGLTLTKNEIKDVVKVIRSLENRRILLKETTRKITSREGGFLSFHK